MSRKVFPKIALGLTLLGAVGLAGCAQPPATSQPSETPSTGKVQENFKACMVSVEGGFSTPVGKQAEAGLSKSQEDLGIETNEVEADDIPRALQQMVSSGCKLIFGVGEDMTTPLEAAAKTNPDVNFALLGGTPNQQLGNLKPMVFNTHEVGFLAGYLAASQTKSGTVGVFGGLFVPSVTMYLDGFVQGVSYYNGKNSADVKVVGWDQQAKSGSYITDGDPFNNPDAAKTITSELIGKGADVIMPVAEVSNKGAIEPAKAAGAKLIWSGVDGCTENADACDIIIASAIRDYSSAVSDVIYQAKKGEFSNTAYIGTLKNAGAKLVGLSSDEAKAKIREVSDGIVAGGIEVHSDAAVG